VTSKEESVPEANDEERALLDAYAQATSPSAFEIERALTRTLARIESSASSGSLPRQRHRFVWVAAAGIATLVIATAAIAGVRWYRARPQTEPQSYGAAQLDRIEDHDAVRSQDPLPADAPTRVEPAPELPEAIPEGIEPTKAEPATRRRARAAKDPTPDVTPPVDASQLAAESRLLGLVRRAIRDNDFEAALAWAEQHARDYPQGSLTEERLILEAVAACRGGQRERGLAVAKQLREQFPSTAALTKVEQSCAGD
jgi:hypothetical protein